MGVGSQDAIKQFQEFIDQVEEPLRTTFKNVHQGFVTETLMRFLKARDWDPYKAQKMLVDCLNWRVQNEIDNILSKPIFPADLYRAVRDSQLIGLSGYSREGLPVFAIGVGLSTFDKASVHYYMQSHIQINEYRDRIVLPSASEKQGRPITTCIKVLDMTGLKLSALNQIKLLTIISSIDDLNYPEKTNTYYIVNAPYIFSACWKVVKPLLQERTKRKIQVLPGCGRDELLTIMDYSSLPHFCRREGSGSSRHSESGSENCYSLDHPFHQGLYNHIKQQARLREAIEPITIVSFFSTKSSHSLAFALHASNSSFDILILPLNLEYGTLPTSDKILISLTALCSAAFASLASTRTSSSFSSASSATALDFSTSHFSS